MFAFLPVIFSSLAAFSYAAPTPAPTGANGGVLGDLVNTINQAEADIKGLLPNITTIKNSPDGAQALIYIVQTFENDVVKIGGDVAREIAGDLNTIENVNENVHDDIQKALDGFLDAVSDVANKTITSAEQFSGDVSNDIKGILQVVSGISQFIKGVLGNLFK